MVNREYVHSSISEAYSLATSSPQKAVSLISEVYRWLSHRDSEYSDLLDMAAKPFLSDEQILLVDRRIRTDILRVIRISNFPNSLTSEEIMLILTLIIEVSDKDMYLTCVYNLNTGNLLGDAVNEVRELTKNSSLRQKFDQQLNRLLKNNLYSEPKYFNKLIYG